LLCLSHRGSLRTDFNSTELLDLLVMRGEKSRSGMARRKRLVQRRNANISRNQRMGYRIELIHSEPVLTAVIRGHVPAKELPRFVPAACGEVWSFIRSAGLPRPGRHMALYLDGEGGVEVGAEVSEPFDGNERVYCSKLPAGRVATTVHFGPYGRLSEAHAAIRQWCAEHGHRCSGVSWEIYGHWDESWNTDSSKIRTDVFYLLQGAKEN
jgi:effector-binding domain-containing protein